MAWPQEVSTATWLLQSKRDYLTIDCGAWSYGRPRIRCASSDIPRRLTIGRYCSIAEGVEIFVGRQGRHSLDTLSTYPIAMAVSDVLRAVDEPRRANPKMFSPSKEQKETDLVHGLRRKVQAVG
jgi:hypothetical protein